MDTRMTKGENAMEAVATARIQWLNASVQYIKTINQALQMTGANPKSVDAVMQSLQSKPFPSADEYDQQALHARDATGIVGSPLESRLLRLTETSSVCGGAFPEELFETTD
jgi:hypothetical protein